MTLEDVGADNWRACTALEVRRPQQRFVAPVAYYLALCAYGDNPRTALLVMDELCLPATTLQQDVIDPGISACGSAG